MKLVYVPDWLSSYLTETNQPLSNLSSISLSTAIVSKVDVINYYKAQYEFIKLMFSQVDSNFIGKNDPLALMAHQPDLPEIELYIRTQSKDTVDYSYLLHGLSSVDTLDFSIEHDPNHPVVYIIGKHADTPSWKDSKGRSFIGTLLSKLFRASQANLRVETQFTDKATVLRENPVLAQLYVKSIIS